MTVTITSARYANDESTAVIIDTVERGDIAISVVDTPDLWAQLQSSAIAIAPSQPSEWHHWDKPTKSWIEDTAARDDDVAEAGRRLRSPL